MLVAYCLPLLEVRRIGEASNPGPDAVWNGLAPHWEDDDGFGECPGLSQEEPDDDVFGMAWEGNSDDASSGQAWEDDVPDEPLHEDAAFLAEVQWQSPDEDSSGAGEAETEPHDNGTVRYPPPSSNPDRWDHHPAGPAGSWLRAKVQNSWDALSKLVGKDLFYPPAQVQGAPRLRTTKEEERNRKAVEQANALRDELLFTTPDKALQPVFGGEVGGYIFTTRDGNTGYFRDDAPFRAAANQTDEQQDLPAVLPVTIAISQHIPDTGAGQAEQQRKRPAKHRRLTRAQL